MDKCRWAKIKIQKRNPWLSKPEWRFEDKTLNFKVSEGAEQKPRHINYHIYNFHLKKINHRRSSFKFSKCLFLKLKPLNSAPPIISIFNEKEWPFRNGMLFPTAALVVQFSGSDFVASWQVTKDLYGCCGCGCCRGLWFPWEFFGVATVESCPWFSKRIPQKKKKPWNGHWNILGKRQLPPKIYRYTRRNERSLFWCLKKTASTGTSDLARVPPFLDGFSKFGPVG